MKKKNKKIKFILVGIIVLLLSYIAYNFFLKDSKVAENIGNTIEEKIEEVKPDVKKIKIVDENSTSRPYAVMINNISTARKLQSGLQDAYIMYEMIVEGGITRYMALFMDTNTERIGSIRSARHYYIDYALENDAFYVHHGQSPQAQSDFSKLGVDRIVVDSTSTGWRDKTLNVSSEHTLFTSTEKLANGIGSKRTKRNKDLLLNYSVDSINMSTILNAQKADNISIRYSKGTTSQYTYDEENKYYLRSVNNTPHTDYVTKEQYHFKNIITYQVANSTINDGENKGRQTLDNIGKGTGYYITEGYAIPIKWEKKSRSEQTIYYYESGEELKVNDGNTFIQIQPKGETLSISANEVVSPE